MTNPDGDLKSSQTRLNAIDDISAAADELFAPTGADPSWSVNQQGMDQIDYQSPDGNTAITKWFSSGEDGSSAVQAEEAQLPNGELIDRWYNDNGGAQQVMHQYDKNNSYSVYYYDTGEIEATRVIKDGNEIFTKYDRDGRQIQRTYTPASAN
jgi:antitoxin component YwqK of YwqJK toxin-antitoxin module